MLECMWTSERNLGCHAGYFRMYNQLKRMQKTGRAAGHDTPLVARIDHQIQTNAIQINRAALAEHDMSGWSLTRIFTTAGRRLTLRDKT